MWEVDSALWSKIISQLFHALSHHKCNREESSRSKITWVSRSKFVMTPWGISSSVIVVLKIFYLIHARNKYKSSDLYLWYMKLLRYYVYPPIYFSTRLLNDFTLPFSTFFRICYYPIYYPCCTLCLRDSEDNLNGDHAKLHLFWTVAWSVFITQ